MSYTITESIPAGSQESDITEKRDRTSLQDVAHTESYIALMLIPVPEHSAAVKHLYFYYMELLNSIEGIAWLGVP